MAAADLLNKAGHSVTLFEKDEKAGGLLRFGIPDFKLSKATIDSRINLMIREGLTVRTGMKIGKDISAAEIAEPVRCNLYCHRCRAAPRTSG